MPHPPEQQGQQHPQGDHDGHVAQQIHNTHIAAGVAVETDVIADGVEGLQVHGAPPAPVHVEQAAEKQQDQQQEQIVAEQHPQAPPQIPPPGRPGQGPQAQQHPRPGDGHGQHRDGQLVGQMELVPQQQPHQIQPRRGRITYDVKHTVPIPFLQGSPAPPACAGGGSAQTWSPAGQPTKS